MVQSGVETSHLKMLTAFISDPLLCLISRLLELSLLPGLACGNPTQQGDVASQTPRGSALSDVAGKRAGAFA